MATITELRNEAQQEDERVAAEAAEREAAEAGAAQAPADPFDDGPQDVHAGGEPDPEAEVDEFAQGNLEGGWEDLIGGKEPTTHKVRLYGGGIEVEPPEGGFKKGSSYALRVEVRCHKVSETDESDDKTGQVVGCSDERGLKITGVSVLKK